MRQSVNALGLLLAGALALGAGHAAQAQNKPWYPFKVQVWDPPFDMASPRKDVDYMPLRRRTRSGTSACPSRT